MSEIRTRQQLWRTIAGPVEKHAELSNTWDMPASPAPSRKNDKGERKAVVKTASAFDEDSILKEAFSADAAPCDNEDQTILEENAVQHAQAKPLQPKVNVSGKEPPKLLQRKEAQHYALPSLQRYPLDGYDQVVKAASYFGEYKNEMPPRMRREFCTNLVKRASALRIPTSSTIEAYGSSTWAPSSTFQIAMDARRSLLKEAHELEVFDKVAAARNMLDPDGFACALEEFDKEAGLDEFYGSDIPDPFLTVFAKTAKDGVPKSPSEVDPDQSIIIGNEYLPVRKLVEFATMSADILENQFGEDFVKEFVQDPKAIFDSMPRDQKLVIMRMANNNDSKLQGASTS